MLVSIHRGCAMVAKLHHISRAAVVQGSASWGALTRSYTAFVRQGSRIDKGHPCVL